LLDTHVWAWSLTNDRRITDRALGELAKAQTILVSAISFFEIAQKARLGKWPEMTPYVARLSDLLERQRGIATALEAADSLMAGTMEWPHRDPFDRLLAASALRRGVAIVSADVVFDAVVARIW
jgi:PIN domain nuclease of toxin-antitoxin system